MPSWCRARCEARLPALPDTAPCAILLDLSGLHGATGLVGFFLSSHALLLVMYGRVECGCHFWPQTAKVLTRCVSRAVANSDGVERKVGSRRIGGSCRDVRYGDV